MDRRNEKWNGEKLEKRERGNSTRGKEKGVVLMERQIRSMPWRADSAWGLVKARASVKGRDLMHRGTPLSYLLWDTNTDRHFWRVSTFPQQTNFASTRHSVVTIANPIPVMFTFALLYDLFFFVTLSKLSLNNWVSKKLPNSLCKWNSLYTKTFFKGKHGKRGGKWTSFEV